MTTPVVTQDRKPRQDSRIRRILRVALRQPGSPEKIALGMAVGMFITFTPTIGIQIPLVLILSTICRASRIAALIPIWISNVATAAPIYGFDYWLGAQLLPGGAPTAWHDVWSRIQHIAAAPAEEGFHPLALFSSLWDATQDLAGPMMLGGAVVGLVTGLISYPLTLRLILWYRRRRQIYFARHPNRMKYLGGYLLRDRDAETGVSPASDLRDISTKNEDANARCGKNA